MKEKKQKKIQNTTAYSYYYDRLWKATLAFKGHSKFGNLA